MKTLTALSPTASTTVPLDYEMVVHISVVAIGPEFELRMFPKRDNDTMIFHSSDHELKSPEKPRQVRWVVSGLAAGQILRLEAKTPHQGFLPQDRYEIHYPHNSCLSGAALEHPGAERELKWGYTVSLFNAKHELRQRSNTRTSSALTRSTRTAICTSS